MPELEDVWPGVQRFLKSKHRNLKAPKGAPRNTPRKKIVLENNDANHLHRIPPYVPTRQKYVPKKSIKIEIPTGKMSSMDGSIIDMRT